MKNIIKTTLALGFFAVAVTIGTRNQNVHAVPDNAISAVNPTPQHIGITDAQQVTWMTNAAIEQGITAIAREEGNKAEYGAVNQPRWNTTLAQTKAPLAVSPAHMVNVATTATANTWTMTAAFGLNPNSGVTKVISSPIATAEAYGTNVVTATGAPNNTNQAGFASEGDISYGVTNVLPARTAKVPA